jgi:hypothetical protein
LPARRKRTKNQITRAKQEPSNKIQEPNGLPSRDRQGRQGAVNRRWQNAACLRARRGIALVWNLALWFLVLVWFLDSWFLVLRCGCGFAVEYKQYYREGHPMPRDANNAIPVLRVRKGATKREIYAAARRDFSAADLQKFTEIEPGVDARQLLKELEAIHKEESKRLRKQKRTRF